MEKVLIIILNNKPFYINNKNNIRSIKNAFSHSFFHVEELFYENEPYKNALFYSKYGPYDKNDVPQKKWKNLPFIIINWDTIINVDSNIMYKKINSLLSWGKFDICYLHRYMDNCYNHRKTEKEGINYVSKNNSIQGILYKPKIRDKILNNNDKIKRRVAFVPNLIQYDFNDRISEKDLRKTCECEFENEVLIEKEEFSIFWIFMFIILLILVLLAFLLTEKLIKNKISSEITK